MSIQSSLSAYHIGFDINLFPFCFKDSNRLAI